MSNRVLNVTWCKIALTFFLVAGMVLYTENLWLNLMTFEAASDEKIALNFKSTYLFPSDFVSPNTDQNY